MRVLITAHRFPPDAVAGVERHTESLARELSGLGDEVTVVSRRPGPGPIRSVPDRTGGPFEVIRLTGGGVDREHILHLADELDRVFECLLDERAPQVVHVNHLVDLSPRIPVTARARCAALVMTLHDFWIPCPRITLLKPDGARCGGPEGGRACGRGCAGGGDSSTDAADRWVLRALYTRRLLDLPDRIVCPSAYVAHWFEEWGVDPDRLLVRPNGVDVPEGPGDPPEPRRDGRLRLAILGAVAPHKGHHVVLDALAGADAGPVTLFVHGPVGDPAYLGELRSRAAEIGDLELRVCGPYEPEELSLLLADVHALVTPSVWPETFCLVIREAHARGVPALTTRLGALAEAIDPGVNGFFYDHDEPAQLRALIGRLGREPELRRRLAKGALATRVTTQAEHAARMREVYEEAIEGRDANRRRAAAAASELRSLERLLERPTTGRRALGEVA